MKKSFITNFGEEYKELGYNEFRTKQLRSQQISYKTKSFLANFGHNEFVYSEIRL